MEAVHDPDFEEPVSPATTPIRTGRPDLDGGRPTPGPQGVRHLMGAHDLTDDKLYGHIKNAKAGHGSLSSAAISERLYPPEVRIAIVLDEFSPHLSSRKDQRVGE